MVDFACDRDGSPIFAVSSLAFHTKDLLGDPRCSLLVIKDPADRTDLVITLHGDAVSVSEEDEEAVRTAYLAKHPNAFWVDFGDFQFVRIKPKAVRYIPGVATALLGSGEFSKEEYSAAVVDGIYQFSKPIVVDSAQMLEVDSLGFNVKSSLSLFFRLVTRGVLTSYESPFHDMLRTERMLRHSSLKCYKLQNLVATDPVVYCTVKYKN
ncbi:hypothetical protein AKJ16_DCAP13825 [Drosera capensis]